MEEKALKTFENEKYRISVFYDCFAEAPNVFYDMCGVMLYTRYDGMLHKYCDWEKLFSKIYDPSLYDMKEALVTIACKYVPSKKILKAIKEGSEHYELFYNNKDKRWELIYDNREFHGKKYIEELYDCDGLNNGDYNYEILMKFDEYKIMDIIDKYGKDIVIESHGAYGYCQGEYQEMFGYCTKERFGKYCEKPGKDWKEKAEKYIKEELKICGYWMYGSVYRSKVEKKVYFTKRYADGTEMQDFEYEDLEDCRTYYCEYPDEALKLAKEDYIQE